MDHDFVLLIQDEQHDYQNELTRSFCSTITSNRKVTRAEPVQIYFGVTEERFKYLWDRVQHSNQPYQDTNDAIVYFPGKDTLFRHYMFNVIAPNQFQSPELPKVGARLYEPEHKKKSFQRSKQEYMRKLKEDSTPLRREIEEIKRNIEQGNLQLFEQQQQRFVNEPGTSGPQQRQMELTSTSSDDDEPIVRIPKNIRKK